MTERLDRIEASIESTAAICASNARAIEATGEQIGELRNTVTAFIQKLDDEGLRVTLISEITDDIGGDVSYLESQQRQQTNYTGAALNVLRQDAIADRQAFREQAEADRLAFREALAEERQRSDQRFEAMQENIQQLFRELIRTNRRVDNLEQAS